MITSAQSRAARGLIKWTQIDLANASEVSEMTIRNFESDKTTPRKATLIVLKMALENAGVIFIPTNGDGPGVRLKK